MYISLIARHPSLLLWLGLSLLSFAGCHSAEKAVELPAAPTAAISVQGEPAVSGELSKFIEVVPGTYQVSVAKDDYRYETTFKVKVRLISPTTIKAGSGYNNFGPVLTARLGDASGAPLDDLDNFSTGASYGGNLASLLKQGKGEEWLTFTRTFIFSGSDDKEPAKVNKFLAMLQNAKKISLTSQIEAERFEEKDDATASVSATASTDDSDTEEAASGDECDAFLKGYEEYVNDYVALAKEMQANPSNTALLTKSSAMSMKAAQWASKAQGCENDAAFQAKYSALSTKMAMGMAQGQ